MAETGSEMTMTGAAAAHRLASDRLDLLIDALEVRSEPFAVCDVGVGWHLPMAPQATVTLHYVLSGSGDLSVQRHGRFRLSPDSVIVCPRELAHRFDAPNADGRSPNRGPSSCFSGTDGLHRVVAGNTTEEPHLLIACGRVSARYGAGSGLFDGLAEPIIESFAGEKTLSAAFGMLLTELASPRPGTRALTELLMKQCLIYILRRLYENRDQRLPWLAAIADPRLSPALEAIFKRPEADLSVETLAGLVGMSRASFTSHFTRALGMAPHEFLTDHRLTRAARLLATTELPVKAVAGRVGYRSRSHFSQVFQLRFGTDPASYRAARLA